MNRRPMTLFFALLFMILPLVLALSERKWADQLEEERRIDEVRSRATVQLQQMRESANLSIQLQSLLTVFCDGLAHWYKHPGSFGPSWLGNWHRQILWFILPDHDLVVGEISPDGFRTLFDNQGPLGFSGKLAPIYLPLLDQGLRNATDVPGIEEFWKALHFPIHLREQESYFHGRMQHFHGVEGGRGFFWRTFPQQDPGRKLIMGILIDTQKIDPFFDLKAMVKGYRSLSSGIGFLSLSQGRNILSPFFRNYPLIRRRLLRAKPGAKGFPRFERHGSLLLFSLPPTPGKSHQALVAFKLSATHSSGRMGMLRFLVLLSILVAAGMVIVVERVLFKRGPRLMVGTILLAAFLLTAFIPIIGATVIARQNLLEEEKKIRQDSEISLLEQLQQFDTAFRLHISGLVQSLVRLSFAPRLAEELGRDETLPNSSIGIRNLASQAEVLLRTPGLKSRNPCRFIAISTLGPNDFLRSVIHPESPEMQLTLEETKNLQMMWSKVFSILQRPIVERIAPQQAMAIEPTRLSVDVEQFQFEEVNEALASLAGSDAYLTFVYYWSRLLSFQSAAGTVSMIQLIIPLRGTLRYLVTWLWDEYTTALPFLSKQLEPGGLLKKKKSDTQIFIKLRHQRRVEDSIPPGLSRYASLERLGEAAAHIDQPLQSRGQTASGPLLLCAVPGRAMSKGVFCGRKIITEMAPKLAEQERKFYLAMIIAILLALLAALIGSQYVTSPLKVVLEAIQQINRENYGARIHFPERGDEFASLGAAFNGMAQGLQEGRILARYVSTTVQEAVNDSSLSERATEGEIAEVTILFTGLTEFDAFSKTHSPGEVFDLLEANLEIVNEAVSTWGGEIDKVMGEKVLILFRHDRFASGEQAMNAAMNVVRHVRDLLPAQTGFKPVFGLNSGSVVAGFVGAQNVRMDYTVIGDPVNLAARLVALGLQDSGSGIIASGPALNLMTPDIRAEKLETTRVKGKTQEVEAYRLTV